MKIRTKHLILKSMISMFISIFILHVILIIQSIDQDSLSMVIKNKLEWSELSIYLYQFAIVSWTGFVLPICIYLLEDTQTYYHLKVAINVILTFSVYFLWITFSSGMPNSIWGVLAIFAIFILADYWFLYGLQYIAMKRKVDGLNLKIDDINGTFLREGDKFNDYKRYPQ